MKKIAFCSFAALLISGVAVASPINCAGVSDVTTIPVADGCDVTGSNLVFDNFDVNPSSGFTGATVGISSPSFGTEVVGDDVDLAFQIGGLSGPGVPDSGDIQLSYTVTGGIIGLAMSVEATPIVAGGSLTVTELGCTQAFVANVCSSSDGGVTLGNLSVTSFGLAATDQVLFTVPYSGTVYIEKDLSYDNATTSSLVNGHVVSAVPEPATLGMMGVGFLVMGLFRRRWSQRNG